jgi:hypothetical protein
MDIKTIEEQNKEYEKKISMIAVNMMIGFIIGVFMCILLNVVIFYGY